MPEELLRRADLVRDQLAHPPLGTRRCAHPVRVGATGSGDDLLVLAWSADELAGERAAGARLFGALGVRAGMRIADALPGALATPGALLLGDVIEEIGALDVPLGVPDSDVAVRAWELFDRVRPSMLVLEPGTAPALFAAAPAVERPWWTHVVWLARATLPAARPSPPPGFGGTEHGWLAVPEVTSFVAHTCAAGAWHVEPAVAGEVVDAARGDPSAAGGEGRLVLAARGVRYVTDVHARVAAGCRCGEAGPVLALR